MSKDKTFEIGELCLVPYRKDGYLDYAYGIVIRCNPLKLRRNFYSVLYSGKVTEHENLFISKIKDEENEPLNTY